METHPVFWQYELVLKEIFSKRRTHIRLVGKEMGDLGRVERVVNMIKASARDSGIINCLRKSVVFSKPSYH